MRWTIAEATGWTLEYIDQLSIGDLWEWQSVRVADNETEASFARLANAKRRSAQLARRGRKGRKR
jgi:hypothetical protein